MYIGSKEHGQTLIQLRNTLRLKIHYLPPPTTSTTLPLFYLQSLTSSYHLYTKDSLHPMTPSTLTKTLSLFIYTKDSLHPMMPRYPNQNSQSVHLQGLSTT